MNHPFLKSPVGETPVIVEAEFNAPVTRLFKAWTTPEDIKQWFGADEGGPAKAKLELKIGGDWEFVFAENDGKTDSLAGNYLRIQPNELLEFTWVHTRSFSDGTKEVSPESKVTITFEPRTNGSFSRLVHEFISSESSRVNIGGGWSTSITKMKALIEQV